MIRRFFIVVCAGGGLLLNACSHVAPYQREHLARPCMDTQAREALAGRFYSHVFDSREGAMGGGSDSAGGGCGCN